MAFADLKDCRLYYRWEGLVDAPVLVLSHSLGSTNALWSHQLASFGERLRLLLYDHRGHGESSTPRGSWSIADFGRDVLDLLDHLQLDRVHFCGVSLGGMTGMWLAQNAAERIDRLVLANTSAKTEDPALLRGRIAEIERAGVSPIVGNVLERWFTEAFRECCPDEVARFGAMVRATSAASYVATSRAVCDLDLRDGLSRITSPTLVVLGLQDRATPPAWNRAIAAEIPGAGLVELDAAHLTNVEASEAFNEQVLRFLASASDSQARSSSGSARAHRMDEPASPPL